MLHDAEAKTGAAFVAGSAFVDAVEAFEDVREVVCGDARAVVAYANFHFLIAELRGDLDARALGRVFERVIEEVFEDLSDLERIDEQLADIRIDRHVKLMFGGGRPGAIVVDDRGYQGRERDGFAAQAGVDGFEAGKRKQVFEERIQPLGVTLDGAEEFIAIGHWHVVMPVDEGLRIAFDDTERRAQLVGDIGYEIFSDGLQFFLLRDVMENEQGPRALLAVERRNRGAGDLDPERAVAIGELHFVLRLGLVFAHRLHVREKRDAVENKLEALVEDVGRAREDFLEGFVREQDVIVTIHNQHRFLETAQRGFELGELPGALMLESANLGDEVVGFAAELIPTLAQ